MTQPELRQTTESIFEFFIGENEIGEPDLGFWFIGENGLSFQAFGPYMAGLLNSSKGKDFLFAAVRCTIEEMGATACLFATEACQFEENPDRQLSKEEFDKKVDAGFATLVREGYGTVSQSLTVVGMTPEWFCIIIKKFNDTINDQRVLTFYDEPLVVERSMAEFKGRMKIFGPFSEPQVENIYNQMKAVANGRHETS